ncbi:DUF397 domain-containing protein [Streptomyces sp. SPB074]|uniref:DUF397 domain-containing protein n=1 Tax=Streptomyces sp. (strain SPB074) TaxID=465543 RepID=UPI00017F2650|nr:DUF397 domain-containing protein [Streptomyces sp. SPB074]EDY46351.1 conserved hypothetical protein [Streptomyces sp. SPB074]
MSTTPSSKLTWHKSSYSGGAGGNCVEVASPSPARALARDSKTPAGPLLTFASPAWSVFVSHLGAADRRSRN